MGNRYQRNARPGGPGSGNLKNGVSKFLAAVRDSMGPEQNEEETTYRVQGAQNVYPGQISPEDEDDGRILRHRPDSVFNPATGTYTPRDSRQPERKRLWPWFALAFAAVLLYLFVFDRGDPVTAQPTGSPPAIGAMANANVPTDQYQQNTPTPRPFTPTPRPAPAVTNTPAPTPTPAPEESSSVLKYGSKNEAVKKLQQQLIDLGYIALGGDDGAYGDVTKLAVQSFQKVNKLDSDGIAGEKTLALLDSGTAKEDPDVFVWAESKGKVYHDDENCSGMKDPKQLKLSKAKKNKLTPCDVCDPPKAP